MTLGKYAGTILACYGAVALLVVVIMGWLIQDGRRLARQLAELEARGVRRRSASDPARVSPEPNNRP